MLFNSVPFLIFLPVVVILYYLLPFRYRWIFLLLSGYVFYGFLQPQFLILLLLSTSVDFFFALKISEARTRPVKRWYLAASLCFNIGLLFVFKYLSLFLPAMDPMMANIYKAEHPWKGMLLNAVYFSIPVGISFYTFQSLSYTFDVFYGKQKAETNLFRYATFVAYFPPLVAGPIERFHHLSTQIFHDHKPLYENFAKGFRLMLLGFFMKMCIADQAGNYADAVFSHGGDYNRAGLLTGIFMFGLQIYADFGGYSLIALGASSCLGIHLIDNFRNPYFSTSIREFWKRWHLSLTGWFRDYLYMPLGGNRVPVFRWVINVLLVFLISGFWHGANYTFIIWGAIHGVTYLAEHFAGKIFSLSESRFVILKFLGGIKTFILVNLAWVFFRSATTTQAIDLLKGTITPTGTNGMSVEPVVWVLILVFLLTEIWFYNSRIDKVLETRHPIVRWLVYGTLLACIFMFSGTVKHPFVYFQF